jgi:hypothetical protein
VHEQSYIYYVMEDAFGFWWSSISGCLYKAV